MPAPERFKQHPYAILSFPELSQMIKQAGFTHIKTYTSFEARVEEPVGPGRMLNVATKN